MKHQAYKMYPTYSILISSLCWLRCPSTRLAASPGLLSTLAGLAWQLPLAQTFILATTALLSMTGLAGMG